MADISNRPWTYWVACFVSYIIFPFVWVVCVAIKGHPWTRQGWLRRWEDYIDDPIDYLKERIHCARIPFTRYQINISFLMNHRPTTWDIIRPDGDYDNCKEQEEERNDKVPEG